MKKNIFIVVLLAVMSFNFLDAASHAPKKATDKKGAMVDGKAASPKAGESQPVTIDIIIDFLSSKDTKEWCSMKQLYVLLSDPNTWLRMAQAMQQGDLQYIQKNLHLFSRNDNVFGSTLLDLAKAIKAGTRFKEVVDLVLKRTVPVD